MAIIFLSILIPYVILEFEFLPAVSSIILLILFPISLELIGVVNLSENYPRWCSVYYLGLLANQTIKDIIDVWEDISYVRNPLVHEKLEELASRDIKGLCLEGSGGCGKSTALRRGIELIRDSQRERTIFAKFPNPKHPKLVVAKLGAGNLESFDEDFPKKFSNGVVLVIDDLDKAMVVGKEKMETILTSIQAMMKTLTNIDYSYFLAAGRSYSIIPSSRNMDIQKVNISPPNSQTEKYRQFILKLLNRASNEKAIRIDKGVKERIVDIAIRRREVPLYISSIVAFSKDTLRKTRIDASDIDILPKSLEKLYQDSWNYLETEPPQEKSSQLDILMSIAFLKEIKHIVNTVTVKWIYLNLMGRRIREWNNAIQCLDDTIWFSVSDGDISAADKPYDFVRKRNHDYLLTLVNALFSKVISDESSISQNLSKEDELHLLFMLGIYYLDAANERQEEILSGNMSYSRGEKEMLSKSYECSKKAIDLDGSFIPAYFALAYVLYMQEKFEEAVDSFQQAVRINRNNADAYVGLAQSLMTCKRYEEAIKAFSQAIKLDKNMASAYLGLGQAYQELYAYVKAVSCYQQALELDEDNAITWESQGYALHMIDQYEDAAYCYRRALQLNKDSALPWGALGFSLIELNDYDEAAICFRQAIVLDDSYVLAWHGLGQVLYGQKRHEEALECFKQEIELEPSSDKGWRGFYLSLFNSPNSDEKLKILEEVLRDHLEEGCCQFRRIPDKIKIPKRVTLILNNSCSGLSK